MAAIIDQRPTTNDQRPTTNDQRPTTNDHTFCTLFQCRNQLITKDVGLIPYGMHKYCGYDSFITAYPEEEFPNLKDTPGLRVERVPKITGEWLHDSCEWLKENAKRIDVLNIYHLNTRSFKHAITYKRYNPKGTVYLKFDGTNRPARFKLWKNIKPYITLHRCGLVSTEFQENTEMLSRKWHHRIICVSNPLNPNEIHDYRPFSERSNTILTVGRLGTKQKATEILLEAFVRIADMIPQWKLKLVGQICENMNIADEFFAKYPDMKERVIFAGEIVDREMISEVYRDSKIFAFPSRFEGCSIALAEALGNGLFVVSSNIRPNELMTQHFKFALGSDIDDIDSLAKNLLYACTHESEIESLAIEGRNATLRRCDLKTVCEIIAEGLK